jgi:hypothetical protein
MTFNVRRSRRGPWQVLRLVIKEYPIELRQVKRHFLKGEHPVSSNTVAKWVNQLTAQHDLKVLLQGGGRGRTTILAPGVELMRIADLATDLVRATTSLKNVARVDVESVDQMERNFESAMGLVFYHTARVSLQLQSVSNKTARRVLTEFYYDFLEALMGYLGTMAKDSPIIFKQLIDRKLAGYLLKMSGNA